MAENRLKIKLNSMEKLEEILQETYDQACRLITEVENEMNKLKNSINLADEDVGIEGKAKYAKSMHDYIGDKDKAIKTKHDIAKTMHEVIRHNGDIEGALNDGGLKGGMKLDVNALKRGIAEFSKPKDTTTYTLKDE